jgi:hypothetical protein
VFCVSAGVEEAAYVEAAATYFPRNSEEEIASRAACEGEQLDEFGDVVLGRSVSIGRVPADTQALVDAGRGGASGGSAAHQAADWSQTLLRYDRASFALQFAFVYLSCIITRRPRSHARC